MLLAEETMPGVVLAVPTGTNFSAGSDAAIAATYASSDQERLQAASATPVVPGHDLLRFSSRVRFFPESIERRSIINSKRTQSSNENERGRKVARTGGSSYKFSNSLFFLLFHLFLSLSFFLIQRLLIGDQRIKSSQLDLDRIVSSSAMPTRTTSYRRPRKLAYLLGKRTEKYSY